MTPHKSCKIGLDRIYKRYNPGQFKRIVWGHRSLTVVIFPHQFAQTGWFIESGQSSSCSFWICQSIPCFLKFQFLWRHSYIYIYIDPDNVSSRSYAEWKLCGDGRLKTPKWQLQNLGHLSFPSLPVNAPELNGSLCFSFIFFSHTNAKSPWL